ncbi:tetratricopeptide repeat protein, partial [Paenibacillus barengoltzii]|uniref:tetratricopeptide repeat protein n=1 Tax=Paenibacillus barengoltzii TaxID=343517 RepID=UPI003A4D6436
ALGDAAAADEVLAELQRLMRGDAHNVLQLAADYLGFGLYDEAVQVMQRIAPDTETPAYPMLHYTLAYAYERTGQVELAARHRQAGAAAPANYCFPNSLTDLLVLQSAIAANPGDAKAHYYLGNWMYDKKRPDDAIAHWEASREADAGFPTVHRNLALAYYNKRQDVNAAREALETAFALNSEDARVFYELDQLYKKRGRPAAERFAALERHLALVEKRDDLYLEYVTLLNTLSRHDEALRALEARRFHPWEGGEGKVTGQYRFALVELGKQALAAGNAEQAIERLERALVYPENLGEGKLAGTQENDILYYLGCAYEGLGLMEQATPYWQAASQGLEEPAGAMYYNDQPPEMIFYQGLAWRKLGVEKEAKRRFNKLVDYAEKHLFDEVEFDYFAVSLPDFLVFEDDLNRRNVIHCRFMRGLGKLGLGRPVEAAEQFDEVLALEPSHQGAMIHRRMC